MPPRAVVVTRASEYDSLLARHGTREQVRFFLESRGQSLTTVDQHHRELEEAMGAVAAAIPLDWRRAAVSRDDLDRFLFAPEDVIVAVGQDGLVANVAKYLRGQPVIGINPSPDRFDGVLVRHRAEAARSLMIGAAAGVSTVEARTMAQATSGDGQCLVALNEIFIGHRSHQSARYRLYCDGGQERQSSSGIIVTTGTGATGWARSICRQRTATVPLPDPTDSALAYFVREAFPSVASGTELTQGLLAAGDSLRIRSEMNEGGVVFGDGIETDHIALAWAEEVRVERAAAALMLVTG